MTDSGRPAPASPSYGSRAARGNRPRRPAAAWLAAWLPLLVAPWLVPLLAPREWPRWLVMWLLAFVIFCGCKWLTYRATCRRKVPLWRQLGYLFAWPGLDASAFLKADARGPVVAPSLAEWLFALGKLAAGCGVLYGLVPIVPAAHPYLVGWVGMIGVVLVLHFGSFHLLSCAWRAAGVEARPLMNRPLAATSLADFWGTRWNTAFRDLTHRFLFRPLASWLGPRVAVVAGFAFSGVVHDVVISWPAGGGYGGPTGFFLLQGAGILAERSGVGRAAGLGRTWRGWLFVMAILLGPATLLFHRPFVIGIVIPFLATLGAL